MQSPVGLSACPKCQANYHVLKVESGPDAKGEGATCRVCGAIKRLFEQFDAMLRQAGYIAMSGQIVDASLVAAPRQRNTDDEKKAIKEGRIPPNWNAKPAKLRHKDRDARWTVKFTKAKPREDGSTPPVD